MNSVFYLKINLCHKENLLIFWHWVKIVEEYGANYFILVDSEDVKKKIIHLYEEKGYAAPTNFIASYREELYKMCKGLFQEHWLNVAYAHLTPFIHAKENNYHTFWNIDADDTVLCTFPIHSSKLLREAEKYALGNNLNMFSLDMWYSKSLPFNYYNWTLGIVFTNMNVDYLKKIEEIRQLLGGKLVSEIPKIPPVLNIDTYFAFLSYNGYLLCKSFYCEGLFFEHFKLNVSKFEHSKVKYIWDLVGATEVLVGDDVVKLDLVLTEMQSSLNIRNNILCYSTYPDIYPKAILDTIYNNHFKRVRINIELLKGKANVILFGCGMDGHATLSTLRLFQINVCWFCDNNPQLWSKTVNGVEVISPKQLQEKRDTTVVITSSTHYNEIKAQLSELGIIAVNTEVI